MIVGYPSSQRFQVPTDWGKIVIENELDRAKYQIFHFITSLRLVTYRLQYDKSPGSQFVQGRSSQAEGAGQQLWWAEMTIPHTFVKKILARISKKTTKGIENLCFFLFIFLY